VTLTYHVSSAKAADAATQDFNFPGFDAADFICAMVTCTRYNNAGGMGAEPHLTMVQGYTDGTNDVCAATFSSTGGGGSTDCYRKQINDAVLDVWDVTSIGTTQLAVATASFINDNVRLSFSTQFSTAESNEHRITVTAWIDSTGDTKVQIGSESVGISVGSTQDVTTTGMNPDVVMVMGVNKATGSSADSLSTNAAWNCGWAAKTGAGGAARNGYRWYSRDNSATVKSATVHPDVDSFVHRNITETSTFQAHDITSLGTAKFTFTQVYKTGTSEILYMAIELPSGVMAQAKMKQYDADQTPPWDYVINCNELTRAPGLAICQISRHIILSATAIEGGNISGTMGIYVTDGTNEETHGAMEDDGNTSATARSWVDATGFSSPNDNAGDTDTTAAVEGAFDSFNAGATPDVTLSLTTLDIASNRWCNWLVFESDVAAADTFVPHRQHNTLLRM
jgi:hypothetical protein